jgi:solute:Na+ symporter, SSS family
MGMLNGLDWGIITLYFIAVFGVAWWATRREHTRDNSSNYFLAGRNAGWFIIGASLFASNIGSEHLVGLAGMGFESGVAMGQYEIQASLILLLLGWVFVPFYIKSGVFTMPEFLERRYSPVARWYLAIISIVGYVLTKISVTIAAGGIVFQSLMGINFWTGALIVVVATGIYTVVGGLRAVLYTDMLQMFVLVSGSAAVTLLGLRELGGWGEMRALVDDSFFTVWKPMTDPQFPWTGIIFGAPIVAVWYWCTDQFIVQRVLAAANIEQARRGTIFAGFLKQLPLFIFLIPGVIALALTTTGRLAIDDADKALPTMVGALLPAGARGLVVAGLLAALMSSLSSVFNSCSTLVTWDIYKKLRPDASERRLVLVGQISTLALVAFGLLWIPFMQKISGQIYQYLQSVQAYISPPIAAVFLIGIAWKRVNAYGAVTALFAGFFLGMGRLGLELNKGNLNEQGLLFAMADMNFMHVAIFLFAICAGLLIVVSLLTPAPSGGHVRGLTFQTLEPTADEKLHATQREHRVNVGLSLVLVGIVVAVWLYFTG